MLAWPVGPVASFHTGFSFHPLGLTISPLDSVFLTLSMRNKRSLVHAIVYYNTTRSGRTFFALASFFFVGCFSIHAANECIINMRRGLNTCAAQTLSVKTLFPLCSGTYFC
jgi:hypothetical protein